MSTFRTTIDFFQGPVNAQAVVVVVVVAQLLALSLYVLATVVYRLFWHPLARFPGPKVAAASKWYETYFELLHDQGGAFMYEIDRMHSKYGPIVRINPDELHIRDPTYYRALNAGAGARRDKYPVAANMLDAPYGIFGTVEHYVHRRRRAAIGPSFSKAAVAQAEDLIRIQVEALYNLLCQQDVSECHACFLAFGTEVIAMYAFGYSMNLLNDKSIALDWQTTIKGVEILTPLAKQFTWIIPLAKRLPRWTVRLVKPAICRLLDVQDDMNRRAASVVADRQRKLSAGFAKEGKPAPADRAHILQAVLNSDLPVDEKLPERIGQEGFTTLVAGGDTAAWTLSVAIFHLLSNPKPFAALKAELAEVTEVPSKLPKIKDLEQLPWLNAVLKESLRVWGVTTSRLPLVCPGEDLVYGETVIPRGTPVGMTVRDVLHDSTVYPEPQTFRPERWIASCTTPETLAENERNFVAFGRGNRMCMGLSLAWAEMYLALAMIVLRFDMQLVGVVKERDVDTVRDCFIGVASTAQRGIHVLFTPKV